MELNQYYTDEFYSDVLVRNLSCGVPKTALDIGFGKGSLLYAVKRRWQGTNLFGVDIDESNVCNARRNKDIQALLSDGFDPDLPSKITEEFGNVDLLVSNPPFYSRTIDTKVNKILRDSKISDAISFNTKKIPAEIVFLAQNLRLLNFGQEIGIILPAGIISGERWKSLRDLLCSNYTVSKVIQLPHSIFQGTDAQTFALFLSNTPQSNHEKIRICYGENSESFWIDKEQFINRADFQYYKSNSLSSSSNINCDEFKVFRGSKSFRFLNQSEKEFIHTSHLPMSPEILNLNETNLSGNDIAIQGDILIARVGTRCLARTAIIGTGSIRVSDCVIVVRACSTQTRQHLWSILSDPDALLRLKNNSMGVGAKYLTHSTLRSFIIQG
ncbi:N-6 DNA methylase [Lacimicrobium alkaliphilum]|uniref:site-specific DNA-methyltransferase (adenine-specific) n=1 Tax=Lacimicrobium alkaliphilum TaxID=1526571 RepID=A0A0U3AVX0_9ALTE|nr:N-6 DNA methylase [Lacimicrobium alkaliphilum]ALS97096.1 hypothetical protein AT746_01570 [Lacimicrobium alkaliphilum]